MLKVSNLNFAYRSPLGEENHVLKDVNFEVEDNAFTGLIGATGSGKSTLISILGGLRKPDSGTVSIDGLEFWKDTATTRELRFKVGICFQMPEHQLFCETVYEDIAFGPKNMGLGNSEIDTRVRNAAEAMGLEESLLDKSPFELSGGQKRRVAIAGVLSMRPSILILDEPVAGLDPAGRESLLNLLKGYRRETDSTVIMISHSMDDIAEYAEKVMVLKDSGIAYYDTMPEIFKRSQELADLKLSIPEVTSLFLSLKQSGIDISTDVYTIDYAAKQLLSILGKGKG